ncbi:MAG: NADH-quinone oxidoreductase subunit M [Candidatus Sumerlaeia bacterium]|nr:NADH-quinone oxidoreductase subunit M [Candidatus Sumerlaeia bacterium]
MTNWLLTLIIFLPLAGALLLLAIPRTAGGGALRAGALGLALADLLLSVGAALQFDLSPAAPEFQFVAKVSWIPEWGASYHVGLDGLSLSLVLLTNFLAVLSILSSFSAIRQREKEYYILLLLLQSGVLGTFLALDLLLFYLFWELMLIPLYFLIGIWGSENRVYATMKFLVYTLVGSLLMLVGILVVYFHGKAANAGVGTFDYLALARADLRLDSSTALWTFLAFLLAFAIKVPVVPFHTWLPDAHTEAPTAGSVLLAGILLKTGVYGIVRFCIPFFPEVSATTAPLLAALGIVGIIYGAFTALAQTDMKRLVAYSSVSHMGFVILGLFAFQEQAVRGGLLQMLNHGISTGGLFLCVGLIYERRHTRRLADFGGLAVNMRRYAALTVIVALSSLGLPGLNGFVGEFLVIVGAFQRHWYWAALAGTGVILGAVYLLVMVQRVFFGPLDKPENRVLSDLSFREVLTLLPVVAMAFAIGLYPKPWLKLLERNSAGIIAKVQTVQDRPREVLVEVTPPLEEKHLARMFEFTTHSHSDRESLPQMQPKANGDKIISQISLTRPTYPTRPTCPIP